MDVRLGHKDGTKRILLEVYAKNEIPFRASWIVVTKRDQVVSGILIEKPEFFPTEGKRRFLYPVVINENKVLDSYIELRFSFESLYSAELNHPASLKGEMTRKYGYAGGSLFHFDDGS